MPLRRFSPRHHLDSGLGSRVYRCLMSTEIPIACDLSEAPDTGPQRMAEYQRLFTTAFVGRERTAGGIRFRLRADDGVEAWVRDLAAREKACCPFFDFDVTTADGEV